MSYSFGVIKPTKEEAIEAVAVELDKVVATQPIHALDRDQALAAAGAFVRMLPDDPAKDVNVSVSGSVSWQGVYPDSHTISGANVSVSASLWTRE